MAPSSTSRFIIIKVFDMLHTVFAYADEHEGIPRSVILEGDQGMHNPFAKIEVEPAKVDRKYVHLRFCYANKYLARRDKEDGFVIADSDKPEEDRNKPSCTMFELVKADDDGHMYMIHVQTGWRAQYDGHMRLCVIQGNCYEWDKFTLVDWNTIVKLPEHVAFKGDNDKYLRAYKKGSHNYVQFSSDDPYDKQSGFRIEPRPDGYVRIKSDYFGKYWRLSPAWIWADESDSGNDFDRLEDAFWPDKIDGETITLRNGANGRYCMRFTADGKRNCLNACVETETREARMVVKELVRERKIHSLIYRLEDAQVFDKAPYVAGKTTAHNKGDVETSVEVEIGYEDQKTTSFDRGVSISAGVTTTIEAQVPEIFTASVQVSYSITGTLQWGTSNTTTHKSSAKGIVKVPARSRVLVTYVGTKATCNVPFSYSQDDKSSTDGKIVYSTQIDGMYTGTNCYDYDIVVGEAIPNTDPPLPSHD